MEEGDLYPVSEQTMYGGSLSRTTTARGSTIPSTNMAASRGTIPNHSMLHQPHQPQAHIPTLHHQQNSSGHGVVHQPQHLPAMYHPTAPLGTMRPQQRLPEPLPAIHQQQHSNEHAATVLAWEAQLAGEKPGSRIIGVIGTPNNSRSMYPFVAMTQADRVTPTGCNVHGEPLYTCQGLQPQGPSGHIYQCLGHPQGEDIFHGHYQKNFRYPDGIQEQNMCQNSVNLENNGNHLDVRDHRYSLRNNTIEHVYPQLNYSNSLQHRKEKQDSLREAKLDPRIQRLEQSLEDRLNPSLDQRSVYHYSGSDYSSTEPLYMQRYPCHSEIGNNTPTLRFDSLRTSSRGRGSSRGIRPEFLERSGSSSNSTNSSSLPVVSALLKRDSSTHMATVATNLPRHSKGGGNDTPTKIKRKGLFRTWKVKFLRGEGNNQKTCLLLAALAFVIILVLGIIATILFLTLGGNLSFFSGTSSKLVEFTDIGNSVVDGEFVISNHNFQPAFADENSEPFRYIADSIEHELDEVFSSSPWSVQYNRSQVMSFSPVPLLVQLQIILNSGDEAATQNISSAFLKGLSRRQGHYWLGPYTIDITSVRFTEDLVDSSTFSTLVSTSVSSTNGDATLTMAAIQPTPYLNVGWSSWGSWSTCSPCAPQYDQVRTRQCRLDAGRGLLINTIEPCLPLRMSPEHEGSGGDMESRPCQCQPNVVESDIAVTISSLLPRSSTTEIITSTSTAATTSIPTTTQTFTSPINMNMKKEHLCGWCLPGQVCVSLQGEDHPSCREPLDDSDNSGCGGLCILDSEVCQSLGQPHAFRCQSGSQCLQDEWRCKDGLCIPSSKRCDGHMNCYDRTDEDNCQNYTSPGNSSLTSSNGSKAGQVNSLHYLDDTKSTSVNIANGDVTTEDPIAIGGTQVVMTGVNRTAIGLSSLSHRERELLS